jgi:hypothetical protein
MTGALDITTVADDFCSLNDPMSTLEDIIPSAAAEGLQNGAASKRRRSLRSISLRFLDCWLSEMDANPFPSVCLPAVNSHRNLRTQYALSFDLVIASTNDGLHPLEERCTD